jgi:hypothetical protein
VPTVRKSTDDGNSWSRIYRYDGATQAWDGFHSMGLNRWGVLLYYFGNARKQISAFTSLMKR